MAKLVDEAVPWYGIVWTGPKTDRADKIVEIESKFHRLGPIAPEIAGKFINTLAFVEDVGPDVPAVK